MDNKEAKLTKEVIDVINEELAYQTSLSGTSRADNIDHGIAGRLVTIQAYLNKAQEAWVMEPGYESALHNLRKIASIAIRGMLHYGVRKREIKSLESK